MHRKTATAFRKAVVPVARSRVDRFVPPGQLETVTTCKGSVVLVGAGALASECQAELQPAKRRRTAHLDASFHAAASFGNFPHPSTITLDNAFPIDQLQVRADLL